MNQHLTNGKFDALSLNYGHRVYTLNFIFVPFSCGTEYVWDEDNI